MDTLYAGAAIEKADSALILIHGRGASAQGMLPLAEALKAPAGMAVVAPQAPEGAWYPQRFIAPLSENEPHLSAALGRVGELVTSLEAAGIPAERIVLAGFSQGACLATEFAVRNARRYGAILAFSGGLIGPPGTKWDYAGTLDGTHAFIGCADADPHIPVGRVEESARVLDAHGARVTARVYRGAWHSIIPDEIAEAREVLATGLAPQTS